VPYIDTNNRVRLDLTIQEGDTFETFKTRVVSAMMEIDSNLTSECAEAKAKEAWAAAVMKLSSEVTVTLKRDLESWADMYDGDYADLWYGDWYVSEIHSNVPSVISQFNLAKSRAKADSVYKITKSVDDQQLVFGWANIAIDKDGNFPLDWDGDVTKPEELEKAAYNFVLKYRETGEQHQGEAKGQLVESVMFTKEKQVAMGIPDGVVPEGWWVGFHIEDSEVFKKIKDGTYEMFSVEGTATRVPTNQE
jgi:hypothetical protein